MRSAVDANVGSAPDRLSLVWCRVEDTPKAGRNLGSARNMVRGGSLVALNLCVMRRYYLREGNLVSTAVASDDFSTFHVGPGNPTLDQTLALTPSLCREKGLHDGRSATLLFFWSCRLSVFYFSHARRPGLTRLGPSPNHNHNPLKGSRSARAIALIRSVP